jgi:hypothetical protein
MQRKLMMDDVSTDPVGAGSVSFRMFARRLRGRGASSIMPPGVSNAPRPLQHGSAAGPHPAQLAEQPGNAEGVGLPNKCMQSSGYSWGAEIGFENKFEFPILVKSAHTYQVQRRDQLALVPSAGGGSHAVWPARQGSARALAVCF